MTECVLSQLIDLEKFRAVLEAQNRITGVCFGILDLHQNILMAEGWQDICTRFHRVHPVTCARCKESNESLTSRLLEHVSAYQECRCKNGLRDVVLPIIIGGRHLANFFIGQFFYDDDETNEPFFRAQAIEFGFDEEEYISALRRVPVFTRVQVRNFMDFYHNLIDIMVEIGLNNMDLAREITERKKSEESLHQSRDFLDKIINSISDPIFVKDREHRLILVNDAECALAGRTRKEMLGRTDHDFFPRKQVDVFWEKDETVFETEQENVNEEEITAAGGETRVIVTKKSLYKDHGGKKYLVGIIRDVTKQKRIEAALRRKRESLAQAQRIGRIGSWDLDLASGVLTWSDEIYHIFEVDSQRFGASYEAFLNAIHPDDRKMVDEAYITSVKDRIPYDIVHRLLLPDGRIKFVRERCETCYGVEGKPLRSQGTVQDITENRQAEEQLALMHFALNNVHEAAFLVDEHARFHYVNHEACRSLGYSRDELLGLTVADVDPDSPLALWPEHWNELKAHGSLTFEGRHKKKNGKCFPVEINANYFEYNGEGYNLGLVRDITERKRMEAELKESEALYRHSSNLLASILESASSVSVYALDREYRYLSFNRRHRDGARFLWGADIAVGMSILDAISTEEHREFCRQGFDRVLSGRSYTVESREVVVEDGRLTYEFRENYGSPIFNDDGDVVGLTVFAFSITDRKRMEERLREREQRYRDVFENVSDGLYLLEVAEDGRFRNIEVNPALERSTGLSREEMIGRYVDETVSGEAAIAVVAKYRRCVETGTVIDEEMELDLPAGKRTYHSTLIPIRDGSGRIHRIAGISRDITDRRKAEELLRKKMELETRLERLAEISPGAVLNLQLFPDGGMRIPFASPRIEEVTGFRPEELADDASITITAIHPDDQGAYVKSVMESAAAMGSWQHEFRINHPAKGVVWVEGRAMPERLPDGSVLWHGFLHDISRRKRREAQEKIRLRIFELLAQGGNLNDILYLVVKYIEMADPDFIGSIMLVDEEGKHLRSTCSPNLPEDYAAAVNGIEIGEGSGTCGTAVWRGETIIAEDVRTHPFWVSYKHLALKAGLLSCWSEPIFDSSGKILGAFGIYRRHPGSPGSEELELVRRACHLAAIAVEQKRAEEALRESEARYRALFEDSIDGVFISSVEGKIIDINMTGIRIFGYESKEEMTRLELARDVYANIDDRNRFLSVVDRKGSGEYEVMLRKKNGETMLARISTAVVRNYDGNVKGYQGVIRDVTEERRLEQELFKAKKMEIIGQLAGGVAHEVRNPLNAILSISEALFREKEIADNPEYLPYIQHMRTQVGRLSKLMSDLLDLGKPIKPANMHLVLLPEVCDATIELWKMSEAARDHSVTFDREGILFVPRVCADSERLQQVLLNLMDNAAQHSPKGAGIVLSIERTGDREVAVRIRDSGKGIAPEKIERVFDPFFTTRTRGTGLGLALVKHFVESMGGSVKIVNNEPPPGCTAGVVLSV